VQYKRKRDNLFLSLEIIGILRIWRLVVHPQTKSDFSVQLDDYFLHWSASCLPGFGPTKLSMRALFPSSTNLICLVGFGWILRRDEERDLSLFHGQVPSIFLVLNNDW